LYTGFWWGNLRERDRFGVQGVDRKIMLGWIFKNYDVGVVIGLGWLRIEIDADACEFGEEPSGFI
jgi:hypothetical protein